jgi:hypothetical protein
MPRVRVSIPGKVARGLKLFYAWCLAVLEDETHRDSRDHSSHSYVHSVLPMCLCVSNFASNLDSWHTILHGTHNETIHTDH